MSAPIRKGDIVACTERAASDVRWSNIAAPCRPVIGERYTVKGVGRCPCCADQILDVGLPDDVFVNQRGQTVIAALRAEWFDIVERCQ